ncbi:MAG: hypothetical protein SFU53_16370 [Terrimicrobiaceae bacterium]|nr:hypothetical protein [Terrimicrobiaceae bacterium]
MNFNKSILWVYVLLVASMAMFAQTELETMPTPSPTPIVTNQGRELSFVRFWYVGGAASPRVTVAIDSPGKGLSPISSYVRAGRLDGYRMVHPGQSSVVLFDGSVTPDANRKLPPAEPIARPFDARFDVGKHYTIIATHEGGQFDVKMIEDLPPKPEVAPSLRVFSFVPDARVQLFFLSSDSPRKVWESAQGSPFETSLAGLSGSVRIVLIDDKGEQQREIGSFETELDRLKGYTVAIHLDRYDQIAMTFLEDASSLFSEEEVKDFLR